MLFLVGSRDRRRIMETGECIMIELRKFFAVLAAGLMLASCQTTGVRGLEYLNIPSGKARNPAVIVLPTKSGVTSYIVEFADQLSRHGYVTAVVDFTTKGGADNIEAAYDFLKTQPTVLPNKIGVVGFSKGATQGLDFATYSHSFTRRRVQAHVSYYSGPGAGNIDEKHPPILFLHGDQDIRTSPGDIRNFCKAQKDYGSVCEFHIYKGVTHSFTHSSSWGSYDGAATADAFKRSLRFLDTHLKGKSG